MVVGDHITVLGDDKAAAGGGSLGLLAEDVGAGGRAVDGHGAVHHGGVHLGRLHLGLTVHVLHLHRHGLARALLDGGPGRTAPGDGRAAPACQSACHGAGQDQRRHLHGSAVEESPLLGRLRRRRRCAVGARRVVVVGQLIPIGVAILVAASEVIVVIHKKYLLFRRTI